VLTILIDNVDNYNIAIHNNTALLIIQRVVEIDIPPIIDTYFLTCTMVKAIINITGNSTVEMALATVLR
jgi:hypothetical protein